MTITRTGARLHTESLVIKRGLAQMTDDDYEIKRCAGGCGARISLTSNRKYCRNGCVSIAISSTHKALIQKAISANGEWIDIRLANTHDANHFVMNNEGRNHFHAVRKSALVVSVRWEAA